MSDAARKLGQALVLPGIAAVVALAAAAVWLAVQGGEFRTEPAIAATVVAGLTGGTTSTRAAHDDTRAFLGRRPDSEEPGRGSGLTAVGIFLFVSLPLFIGGPRADRLRLTTGLVGSRHFRHAGERLREW